VCCSREIVVAAMTVFESGRLGSASGVWQFGLQTGANGRQAALRFEWRGRALGGLILHDRKGLICSHERMMDDVIDFSQGGTATSLGC
jgi:hypothetical protein